MILASPIRCSTRSRPGRRRADRAGRRRRLGGGARLERSARPRRSTCWPRPSARTARSCWSRPRRCRSDEPPPPLAPMRAADARAAVAALRPSPGRSTAPQRWPASSAMPVARGRQSVWLRTASTTAARRRCRAPRRPRPAALSRVAEARGAAPARAGRPGRSGTQGSRACRCARCRRAAPRQIVVRASAEDGALLAREPATLDAGASEVAVRLPMPPELRNRMARIEIEGEQSAGARAAVDERWRRRPVGIAARAERPPGQPLLSENYYLERALDPYAELRRGDARRSAEARDCRGADLADAGPLAGRGATAIAQMDRAGGVAVALRRAAASPSRTTTLLPVRAAPRRPHARRRDVLGQAGGAGAVPGEEPLRRPADPDGRADQPPGPGRAEPDLADKTWARLADGTPLVTAEKRGQGWLVLVHTTANTDWSNLALSGLFVEMLQRLVAVEPASAAPATRRCRRSQTARRLRPAGRAAADGAARRRPTTSPRERRPAPSARLLRHANARRALNLAAGIGQAEAAGDCRPGSPRDGFARAGEIDLRPWLLAAAFCSLLADLLIASRCAACCAGRARAPAALAAGRMLLLPAVRGARRRRRFRRRRDRRDCGSPISRPANRRSTASASAGLVGLTEILQPRTAVETADRRRRPRAATSSLFFPLLYWPVTPTSRRPRRRGCERSTVISTPAARSCSTRATTSS